MANRLIYDEVLLMEKCCWCIKMPVSQKIFSNGLEPTESSDFSAAGRVRLNSVKVYERTAKVLVVSIYQIAK